jgi:hypothetical protein
LMTTFCNDVLTPDEKCLPAYVLRNTTLEEHKQDTELHAEAKRFRDLWGGTQLGQLLVDSRLDGPSMMNVWDKIRAQVLPRQETVLYSMDHTRPLTWMMREHLGVWRKRQFLKHQKSDQVLPLKKRRLN